MLGNRRARQNAKNHHHPVERGSERGHEVARSASKAGAAGGWHFRGSPLDDLSPDQEAASNHPQIQHQGQLMLAPNFSHRLASEIMAFDGSTFPASVLEAAADRVLDTLGVTFAGAADPDGRWLTDLWLRDLASTSKG